jgi:hypothetical protein
MKDTMYSKAAQCFYAFLKDSSVVNDLKNKIIGYHKKVSRLQKKMKDYLFKYEYRIGALEEVWERIKNELIKEALTKKASKKIKALIPKLTSMSD